MTQADVAVLSQRDRQVAHGLVDNMVFQREQRDDAAGLAAHQALSGDTRVAVFFPRLFEHSQRRKAMQQNSSRLRFKLEFARDLGAGQAWAPREQCIEIQFRASPQQLECRMSAGDACEAFFVQFGPHAGWRGFKELRFNYRSFRAYRCSAVVCKSHAVSSYCSAGVSPASGRLTRMNVNSRAERPRY